MYYFVKNESGNVSDVTEEIYNRLKDNDAYECWKEDPYKDLPKEVTEMTEDYPIEKGAGWYELSNGDTVRGKEDAIEAERQLK